jgi:hypothetical protein
MLDWKYGETPYMFFLFAEIKQASDNRQLSALWVGWKRAGNG